MPDVFISYSRKDKEFVRRLHDALALTNRNIWIDWEDIPPTANWWAEICKGIEDSDAFLCVLSPDWIASPVCKQEIDYAVTCKKKLVPIVFRDIQPTQTPVEVSSHNWIFIRETDDFAGALKLLIQALETDLSYVQDHTRLLVRAKEWDNETRNDSFLLRGKDLVDAEGWLGQSAGKRPEPTALQGQYIVASRQASNARQRMTISALAGGLFVTLALAILALTQWQVARTNEQTALNNASTAIFALGEARYRGD
jgi:hypothetical protein